jgi:hypothetical protein
MRSRAPRLVGLAFVMLVGLASPAAAHGTAQVPATDYKVEIGSITPAVAGLHVRAVDDGARIELRNQSGSEITVLGYDGEPYLRVGPDGVLRNERSPAVFWNRQQLQTGSPPRSFDAAKAPDWHHISGGNVARWHDHRAHYQGAAPSDGAERVVARWTLDLRQGGHAIKVAGDVRYLPPPSAAPYLLFAALVAVALIVAGRTRAWAAVLAVSVAVLVGAAATQLVGEWGATTLSLPSRIGEHIYVFAGIALGLATLVWLLTRRSKPYDATPIALLAGVALLLASGLTGLPLLAHAILPTTLPEGLVRVLVATTIGVGTSTVVIAGTRLRRPYDRRDRPASRDQESSTATAILRSM